MGSLATEIIVGALSLLVVVASYVIAARRGKVTLSPSNFLLLQLMPVCILAFLFAWKGMNVTAGILTIAVYLLFAAWMALCFDSKDRNRMTH